MPEPRQNTELLTAGPACAARRSANRLADLLVRARQRGAPDYSWAWIALLPEDGEQLATGEHARHHLLIRRNSATGEVAYLRC